MLDQDRPADAWSEMREKQQALCDRLTNARKLQIRSVSGTDLTLGIGGRTWISGCGRSNLPDGEVFSGPIHEEVEGTWCSSFPVFFEGQRIAGARFEIKRGRVVRANADSGQDALTSLLDRDEGSAIVGEIGFGTNQRLKRGTGVGLLDEKIAGTAHIGIGASYPATGSTNRSSVHRDFVCDLRSGGTILVDGEPLFLEATVT